MGRLPPCRSSVRHLIGVRTRREGAPVKARAPGARHASRRDVSLGCLKYGGAPDVSVERPLMSQPACKPGSVGRMARPCARRPFLCDTGCPMPEATYPDG